MAWRIRNRRRVRSFKWSLFFKEDWRSELAFPKCKVSFEDEVSFKEVESEDLGILEKFSMKWSWNSRKWDSGEGSEVSEDEGISMNSGGIPFS